MKLRTFFLTLAAFSMSHSLRITFSFNKNAIQQKYGVGDLFVGTLDAIFCIMFSIGAALYYQLIDRRKILQIYLKIAIGGTISGSFFAIASLFFQKNIFQSQQLDSFTKKAILIASVGTFGFLNFSIWPLNLSLLSNYYKPQTDGKWIGFWSAGWELGNIISLFISNIMVYTFHLRWQTTVILFGFLNLLFAYLLYSCLQNPYATTQGEYDDVNKVTSRMFYKFCKQLLLKKQIFIFTLINGLVAYVFMSLLFWIPIYMVGIDFSHISGYFTVILEVFAIVGAILIGKFYEKPKQNEESESPVFNFVGKYIEQISTFIGIISACVWIFIGQNIYIYGVLIGIFGFFIGGIFNSMHSNDIFQYTGNDVSKTEMFAVMTLITNYFITSVLSVIASIIINTNNESQTIQNQQVPYKKLFYLIAGVLILILMLFIIKKRIVIKPINPTNQNVQLLQIPRNQLMAPRQLSPVKYK